MKNLVIHWDYDDVLFDLITPWVDAINLRYGTKVSPDSITAWEITNFFPTLMKEQIFSPIYEDEFWKCVMPTENAIKVLNSLSEKGHKNKVITNTDYRNIKPKMQQLFKWFPMIKWEDVIITSDKQSVKCDVLIDDNPDNLIGGEYHKILMDRPHNRKFSVHEHKMIRVYTREEAYNEIMNLAQEASKNGY